jgi:hypothetical protein
MLKVMSIGLSSFDWQSATDRRVNREPCSTSPRVRELIDSLLAPVPLGQCTILCYLLCEAIHKKEEKSGAERSGILSLLIYR